MLGKRGQEISQWHQPINHTRQTTDGASPNWQELAAASTSWRARSSPPSRRFEKWIQQAGLDDGLRSDGLTTSEREELNRLRRENRVLREEREILAEAAAWFAQETGTTPKRRSNS